MRPIDSTVNLVTRSANGGTSQNPITNSNYRDGGSYDRSWKCMKRPLYISEASSILFASGFLYLRVSHKPFAGQCKARKGGRADPPAKSFNFVLAF